MVHSELLFDLRVARIRDDAEEIAGTVNLVSRLRSSGLVSAGYDLMASARNLREAAAKLETIANRSTEHAVQEG